MAKIQIKRGPQASVQNLVLAEGEFAVALDTGNVYIGTSVGTSHVNPPAGTAEEAVKLRTARSFSATGDVAAPGVDFDGTGNVQLVLTLANIAGLTAGTYTKLTVDAKGRVTAGTTITVQDLPIIPTSQISGLGSAAALNTGTAAGNVPVLGSDGKLAAAVIPDLAVMDIYEAGSEAAMLALDAQKGDICVRSDETKTYILTASPASTLANWKWLQTPDCQVISVNGKTGVVTLGAADVGAVPTGRKVNNKPLSADISLSASDVGAVPTGRKVNNKPLSADISLSASDVGAAPSSHVTTYATPTAAGHVKIGEGLTVDNGTVSVGDIDGGTF